MFICQQPCYFGCFSMNNADLEKCDPNRPQTIQGDVDGLKENPITR